MTACCEKEIRREERNRWGIPIGFATNEYNSSCNVCCDTYYNPEIGEILNQKQKQKKFAPYPYKLPEEVIG